eukprot:1624728-Heterocapsa_arctica.AAC.1
MNIKGGRPCKSGNSWGVDKPSGAGKCCMHTISERGSRRGQGKGIGKATQISRNVTQRGEKIGGEGKGEPQGR